MDQQTAAPQDGFERMTVEEFNALRRRPQISSMAEAIEFVTGIIDKMGVWPEIIEVLDPDEFEAELAGKTRHDSRFTITDGQMRKMRRIGARIHDVIRFRRAEPMMPELILKFSTGAVMYIWSNEIHQAV